MPATPLDLDRLLPDLRDAGLTGIDVYHSEQDAATLYYGRCPPTPEVGSSSEGWGVAVALLRAVAPARLLAA